MLTDETIKQIAYGHDIHPDAALRAFARAIEQAARAQMAEEAAQLIESTHETTTVVAAGETQRTLTKKKHLGDMTGKVWASAIRALATEKS